jgi:hypothetical protein
MARTRHTLLVNTIEYVSERFGTDAHARVVGALPAARAPRARPSDAAWDPLEDLVAYMEAAQRLLAPDDAEFFRKLGYFAGCRDRATRAISVMVADLDTAMRMAPVIWRSFLDVGRLEVVAYAATGATLRLSDVPARPSVCQRVMGSIAGLLAVAAPGIRVAETACTSRGDPHCELRLAWGAAPGAS